LFLFSSLFALLLVLRPGNIAAIVRNTDVYMVLYQTEFEYYMVNQLNGIYFREQEVDLFNIHMFIVSDAVSEEIGNVMNRYIQAMVKGDLDYYLTTDDIFEITKNFEPELYNLFNHHMTEAEQEHFARTVDDIMDFRALTVEGIIKDTGIDNAIMYIRIYTSLVWIAGFICAVILFFIFYLHRKKITGAFLLAGVPIVLTGLVYISIWVVFDLYPQILPGSLYRFVRFSGGLTYLFVRHGIAFTAVGISSIAAFFVLNLKPISKKLTKTTNYY